MWSLPDIKRLNDNAASFMCKSQIKKQLAGRAKLQCKFCDKPATMSSRSEYFDIFSEDPKGVVGLCKKHEESQGSVPEGYFWCESCYRLFAENYTCELYYTHTEDGAMVCLNCAAKDYVSDPENWITLNEKAIKALDFDQIRKAPHVIAVSGPIPEGIEFFENVEVDSETGGLLTGFSSSQDSPRGTVGELQDILRKVREAGHTEVLLILDAGYQFSVSIGVYVRA